MICLIYCTITDMYLKKTVGKRRQIIKSPLKKLFTLCLVVLMLTCSISLHAYAAYLPERCPNCNGQTGEYYIAQGYTFYVHSDNYGHQRRELASFICGNCHYGWTGYVYFNEPHQVIGNNPCPCGFVPH